jgi:hypothetical protein
VARRRSDLRYLAERAALPYSTVQRWALAGVLTVHPWHQGRTRRQGQPVYVDSTALSEALNLAALREAGMPLQRARALLQDIGALGGLRRPYWVAIARGGGVTRIRRSRIYDSSRHEVVVKLNRSGGVSRGRRPARWSSLERQRQGRAHRSAAGAAQKRSSPSLMSRSGIDAHLMAYQERRR